jgi:polysaccharide biosynthesis protein PslG
VASVLRTTIAIFLLLASSLLTVTRPAGPTVPPEFFGLSIHPHTGLTQDLWPCIQFGGIRLWDTGTQWNEINTARGTYDWTMLDAWFERARAHHVDVLYTFGGTPTWASADPNRLCWPGHAKGDCMPPASVKDWDEFVRALVAHSAGRIKYWELWNEANSRDFWSGGAPPLVEMARHAYNIIKAADPTAIVLTPSGTGAASDIQRWLEAYLDAGGGAYADAIAFHGYPNPDPPEPEYVVHTLDLMSQVLVAHHETSKPVWDTEASWGANTRLPDAGEQGGFVARLYVLEWSRNVQRLYWYAWQDRTYGTLWDRNKGLLPSGRAYAEIHNWLVGAKMAAPCSQGPESIWSCELARPGGYVARIVWSVTDTQAYVADSRFVQWRDLDGNSTPIRKQLSIGHRPILLENTAQTSRTVPAVLPVSK